MNRYKLTVYVPDAHLEPVKDALFAAGAGRFDGYDRCCWQVRGTGQFRPLAGSSPFAGTIGIPETIDEWRIELLCAEAQLLNIKDALLAAHPYERPAYEFVRLEQV